MEAGLGFDFSNYARNKSLEPKLGKPQLLSTGTTIAAAIFDGGVVLGADTRATAGPIVAVKDEMKLHYISDNIWVCGAGIAADNDNINAVISAKLRLFQMNTGLQPRVDQCTNILASRLFQYMGYIQAALIVGGIDFQGPQVYQVAPHGSFSKQPFIAQGSGSLAAISVLENRWHNKMNEHDCMEMVADAIYAGITNDLGSGSHVNLCVIKRENPEDKQSKVIYTFYKDYRVPHENDRNFRLEPQINNIDVEVIKTTERPLTLPDVHLEILDDAPA
ncbi:Family T1, proteasome beta subunit, threonine peptidase [Trichomonas vaginalis G3]|uniref:proteasome endopeptidase complex n=3 Tax=Trichomonas vaginalis (strain ATCC PRA-98 / G3) TaxID=412133 RepID=A2F2T6_TRIV3|nr:threonine-type endopeptidase protein [Trichomonas vaginalis G3]EAY00796.1 Family T1, proteasome beta subunit, threonine peptidase [Trichomonas vaginalis G3]KAI5518644.1 threonine-type endopeptidase protein [Trichomonas vaginalis G3]|eukprot:XP_001313725.1 Family T1, proteasome beta subunit, threonine peptidase [Trichomonas vaginalis G3]